MQRFIEQIRENLRSRYFVMLCAVFCLFCVLAGRLFNLQIVNGEQYEQELTASVLNRVVEPASRGSIYDRYGRPLAVNKVAFAVKIDDSLNPDIEQVRNSILLDLHYFFKNDGRPLSNTLPISVSAPHRFEFNGDSAAELKWKEKAGLTGDLDNLSASEALEQLYIRFEIPERLEVSEKMGIVSLGMDTSDKNIAYLSLVTTLMDNGETIVSDLPISQETPHTFLFNGNTASERLWKESVGMKGEELDSSPDEAMEYLSGYFGVSKSVDEYYWWYILSLKHSLYTERYMRYEPVAIALDVKDRTVALIEERQDVFTNIVIDTDSLREYPMGEYFAHMLGYIGRINSDEYERYKEYTDADGNQLYSQNDIIGKSGIEAQQELNLNGRDGYMLVEVDSLGRRINTIDAKDPESGKDVFLTIDSELQKKSFDYLESALRDILVRDLASGGLSYLKSMFVSMVNSSTISMQKIFGAEQGVQTEIRAIIQNEKPDIDITNREDLDYARNIMNNAIESDIISPVQLVQTLYDQGKIWYDEETAAGLAAGSISPGSIMLEKLRNGEIRPYETAMPPCTGAVAISKIGTGEPLALVTYPSYDNNRLVNSFDSEYYNTLLQDEETTPLVNRALMERKAPGSTFKMITAIAAMETGVISPSTNINSTGTFMKAGLPYARCWIVSAGGSHGNTNVSKAIEVSCNYFFYETMYRMGNNDEGTTLQGITTLNEYMAAFGLNSKTGIEIGEASPTMASPKNKEDVMKWANPEATTSQTRWRDGDSIRAVIGQSVNNYTAAQMTRYIATLANGGTLYKFHIIDKIFNTDGSLYQDVEDEIENILEIKQENLDAVFRGMLGVTQGAQGTLRGVFRGFPINVAAKSGTAQENLDKNDHTMFVAFAPYEDPQIAITVMIPFGDDRSSPAANVAKNIIADYLGLNFTPENDYMENVLED